MSSAEYMAILEDLTLVLTTAELHKVADVLVRYRLS